APPARAGASSSAPPPLTGIVAVSFDVDGTLADNETRTLRSLGEVVKVLADYDTTLAARLGVAELHSVREGLVTELRARDVPWEEIRRVSFRVALESVAG